ncbi:MAG TPA: FAD binding domain-containing protein [Longimicrobiales bacterium]|nr:FAD binding domain-containing protein [Longimicrobiales bacterium]
MLRLHSYEFLRPTSLEQALARAADAAEGFMFIAGGTDLVPNMKHRLFTPSRLIALKQLPELQGIRIEQGELRIGAGETLTTVSRDPLVRQHVPALAQAAGQVAGPQLRNMGTIGGNLCLDTRCTYYNQTFFWRNALGYCLKKDGDVCHVTKVGKKCVAAHSADTPPVLMTLNASVDLAGPAGTRTININDWFVADGIRNTVRRPDEIVTRIRVPLPPATRRAAFAKLRQRAAIDFPLLNVAVAADFEGAVIQEIKMVVSALGARPRSVTGLDTIAVGHSLTPEVADAMAQRAWQQCHPLTNIIVDPDWRRAMVPVYVHRALAEL